MAIACPVLGRLALMDIDTHMRTRLTTGTNDEIPQPQPHSEPVMSSKMAYKYGAIEATGKITTN